MRAVEGETEERGDWGIEAKRGRLATDLGAQKWERDRRSQKRKDRELGRGTRV